MCVCVCVCVCECVSVCVHVHVGVQIIHVRVCVCTCHSVQESVNYLLSLLTHTNIGARRQTKQNNPPTNENH